MDAGYPTLFEIVPSDGARYRILGAIELLSGGDWQGLSARKMRLLLAVLLINANRPVSTAQLIDELWGDRPPKGAVNQLHGYVFRLRRLLGEPYGRRLVTKSPGYQLQVQPEEIDAAQFIARAERGQRALREGRVDQAAEFLHDALALWRGAPLADVPPSPLIEAEAARLNELRLVALEARVDADLALGRHASLVGELRQIVEAHPLRERPWAQLMLALYRSGRRADALGTYRDLRRTFAEELGLNPPAELHDLELAILREDSSLTPPTLTPIPTSVCGRVVSTPSAGPSGRVRLAQLPGDVGDFTGREAQVRLLDDMLARHEIGGCTPAVLVGPAGIGKTALAVHWAHRVIEHFPDGHLYADLHGRDPTPVSPLRILTRFLRALGVPPQSIPDDEEEAAALYRSMLAGQRVLILLDDAGSADQIRPLLPANLSCLVLVTSRQWLDELVVSHGARHVEIDVLTEHEAITLLGRIIGAERVKAEPAAARKVVRWFECLPLALRTGAADLVHHQGSLAGFLTHLAGAQVARYGGNRRVESAS